MQVTPVKNEHLIHYKHITDIPEGDQGLVADSLVDDFILTTESVAEVNNGMAAGFGCALTGALAFGLTNGWALVGVVLAGAVGLGVASGVNAVSNVVGNVTADLSKSPRAGRVVRTGLKLAAAAGSAALLGTPLLLGACAAGGAVVLAGVGLYKALRKSPQEAQPVENVSTQPAEPETEENQAA